MWETARAKLRDWYIFIVGLCLIAGGFFLASHQCTQAAAADAQTPPAEGIASIGVDSVAGREVFRKC
jgi:hypothetical protein